MLRSLHRLVSSLALALAAGNLHAQTVQLTDFSIAGPSGLSVTAANLPGADWYGPAGQFVGVLDGESFVTYCVELPQHADFGVSYTNYRPVDGVTAFGADKAQDLARLISYVGMRPRWSTDSAMVQAAVWEVVHETGRDYSFTSGDVQATGLDGPTQDWLDSFDWAAMIRTMPTVGVGALVSPTNQDFLTVSPVPEPGTYALLGLGLGLVAAATRRRGAGAARSAAAAH
jgi:hypothetical protein